MLPWSVDSGSVNYVFDVGFVYGAGALFESIMVPPQYGNKESTEYLQIVGEAMYEIGGIQTVRYDVDTPDDDTGDGKPRFRDNRLWYQCQELAAQLFVHSQIILLP